MDPWVCTWDGMKSLLVDELGDPNNDTQTVLKLLQEVTKLQNKSIDEYEDWYVLAHGGEMPKAENEDDIPFEV